MSDFSQLTLALQANGVSSARALMQALGVSQPTLSRWLARLGPQIENIGDGRSRRYALRRTVRNFGSSWPVFQIDANGEAHAWGELRALHGGYRLASVESVEWLEREFVDGVHGGLPFPLQDVVPQGFLGRAIARHVGPLLGLPTHPEDWNDDDYLAYLLTHGSDLPGNLVVGERMLETAMRKSRNIGEKALDATNRELIYPQLAAAAQRGEVIGSSAGGEQPKFLTTLRDGAEITSVMVKYTAASDSPVRQRWADLLVCEHLAGQVIASRGMSTAPTQIIDAGGRRFLEVRRFDRTATGRRGMLTLRAIEDALVDAVSNNWIEAANLLARAQLIEPAADRELRWLWCFGDLIANSDMHRSNASFWVEPRLPLRLTPTYDMLPMLYAPGRQGELSDLPFTPRPPVPAVQDVWPDAADAALEFWSRVGEDRRISDDFKSKASRCAQEIRRWQRGS